MMPDLGKYAADVTLAYGISLLCLAALVVIYVVKAQRTKASLQKAEARRDA